MKEAANKFINSFLKSKGISFKADNGYGNVVLTRDNQVMNIAHHCFYRVSGIAVIYKETENTLQEIQVTPDMFYNLFIKHYIEQYFKL